MDKKNLRIISGSKEERSTTKELPELNYLWFHEEIMNCPHCGVLLKNVVIHLKSGWEYCDPCNNCLRVIKWGRSS